MGERGVNGNGGVCHEEREGFLGGDCEQHSKIIANEESEETNVCVGVVGVVVDGNGKCENSSLVAGPDVVNGDPVLLELQKVEEGDIKQPNKTSRCVWCRKYVGLPLILLSGVMLTLSCIVVKKLKDYHPFAQSVYRFQGIFLPSIPMLLVTACRKKDSRIFRSIWPLSDRRKSKRLLLLILRGTVGSISLLAFFFSLTYISVADALVIGSCNPVFVVFVAHSFMNEKCRGFPIAVALITITGICILARPHLLFHSDTPYNTDTLIGVSFASASMLMAILSFVIVRLLKRVHFSLITAAYGAIGTLTNITGTLTIGATLLPQTMGHFLLAGALALLTFLGQLFFTMALKCEQSAGPVYFIRHCNFLFAFLWQFWLLGVAPDLYSIIGASIILIGLAMTAFHKWIATLPPENVCRQKFSFVLK